jgi:1-phosphofructokinase
MIHLVSINPALDYTFKLKNASRGKIGEVVAFNLEPAGKALNIARFLGRWGTPCRTWLGTGGGADPTHVLFRSLLKKEGLSVTYLGSSAPMRKNVVIQNEQGSKKYNHPGFAIKDLTFKRLYEAIKEKDLVVLTGRLPQGMSSSLLKNWIGSLKRKNAKTILDSSGLPLKIALRAKPWFLKVNLHELSQALSVNYKNMDQIPSIIKNRLLKMGIVHGAVTFGSWGAVIWDNQEIYRVQTRQVNPLELVVGAGDGFLTGYLKGLSQGLDFPQRAVLASATGASVAHLGIDRFQPNHVERSLRTTTIRRIP